MSNVLTLHVGVPDDDIVAKLRVIASEIEKGTYGVVTTAVLCIGHTSEREEEGDVIVSYMHETFGLGPRKDVFTVRGLLATCLNRFFP